MTTKSVHNVRRLLVATFAIVLSMQSSVFAVTWDGGVGDYAAGANWVGGVAPGNGDEVAISGGEATLSANFERQATTTIDGTGALVVNGRLLNARGGPADLNVADNASFTMTGNYFIISQENYIGTLNQTGGTIDATIDRGFFVTDGGASPGAASGTLNVLGGVFNASFVTTDVNSNLHNFQAGRRGANDLVYVNGGDVNFMTSVENRRMYFSQDSKIQIDSGSFDADGFEYFVVGYGTSLNGGSVSGTSRMIVNGGTSTFNLTPTGTFVVSDGQNGVVEVNSGAVNIIGNVVVGGDVSSNDDVGRGDFIQRGGVVTVTGEIAFGVDAPGTYQVAGGTMDAGTVSHGGQAESYFGFDGGTVTLDGDVTSITGESWFLAPYGAVATYSGGTDKTTIIRDPSVQTLQLEVNTQTGEARLKNPNGSFDFTTDYYEIRSEQGALAEANWNSLDSQIPDGGLVLGDYNGDGMTDGADFMQWQREFGSAAIPAGSGADGNGNGTVDGPDLAIWESNYGSTGAVGTGWTEAGGSNSNLLAEYVLDEDGYSLASNADFSLGNIFDTSVFGAGNQGDLTFSLELPNGYLAIADVVYINTSLVASASAVPEPASLAMLLTASAFAVVARYRKRHVVA